MPPLDSRFDANSKEVAAQIIGGEAILINLSSGVYYSMDNASGTAWALLAEHHSPAEIAAALSERYDVSAGDAQADVSALVDSLLADNIVQLAEGVSPTPIEQIGDLPAAGQKLAYKKLSLNTYRDMGDLLALDPPMPGIDDIPWKATSG